LFCPEIYSLPFWLFLPKMTPDAKKHVKNLKNEWMVANSSIELCADDD